MKKRHSSVIELRAHEQLRISIDRSKIKDKEAAAKIGIKPPYLSEILNGHRNPTDADKRAIESSFAVPFEAWE